MLAEKLALAHEAPTRYEEAKLDADNFCEAYKDVIGLVKHGLAVAKARFGIEDSDLQKADTIIYSDQIRSYLGQAISNGNYPQILDDEHMRSYIIDMACAGALGRLVELQLHKDRASVSRIYKERMIEMNHGFAALADSELGEKLGFGRYHLKELIAATYGLHPSSPEVTLLEKGIAVEVGTKKCLQELAEDHGTNVRWATAAEDAHNIDIVCEKGDKKLDIQVKSKDSIGQATHEEKRASYSHFEAFGLNEYRVRHLSPAADTAIGEHFEVRALRYRELLDEMLSEFDRL